MDFFFNLIKIYVHYFNKTHCSDQEYILICFFFLIFKVRLLSLKQECEIWHQKWVRLALNGTNLCIWGHSDPIWMANLTSLLFTWCMFYCTAKIIVWRYRIPLDKILGFSVCVFVCSRFLCQNFVPQTCQLAIQITLLVWFDGSKENWVKRIFRVFVFVKN